ncbi:MAG: hypothetical protein ACRAVC_15850 [Trichormus sp.]
MFLKGLETPTAAEYILSPCPMTAVRSSRETRPRGCLPHAQCPMPH